MATKFNVNYEGTYPPTDESVRFNLTSVGGEQTHDVPGDSAKLYCATFYYTNNANVFVGFNGVSATIPGAGSKQSTSRIEFRPDRRYVTGGEQLSLITPDDSAYVGISFLQLPPN